MFGSTIGSTRFTEEYTAQKFEDFVEEMENLAKIVERYPQYAYAAFSHCIMGKWRYIMLTIEDVDTLFQPLEDVISQTFIPALTGRSQCTSDERRVLSLPLRYGDLNVISPETRACEEYKASQMISKPLKDMTVQKKESFRRPQLQFIKINPHRQRQQEIESVARQIRESLCLPKQRMMDLLFEKGTSSWLSVLPLQDQGFNLSKEEFRDAFSLRYGCQLKSIPYHCKCEKTFSADHATICPYGGLQIARQNEVRDITTQWLTPGSMF